MFIFNTGTQTNHLNFQNANGQSVEEMLTKTMRVLGMETIKKVKVSGDLRVPRLYKTKVVNDIEIADYLSQVSFIIFSFNLIIITAFKILVGNNKLSITRSEYCIVCR